MQEGEYVMGTDPPHFTIHTLKEDEKQATTKHNCQMNNNNFAKITRKDN